MKRPAGRPPRGMKWDGEQYVKDVPVTGPVSTERAEEIIAAVEEPLHTISIPESVLDAEGKIHPTQQGAVGWKPFFPPDLFPLELRKAVDDATEIKLVCKVKDQRGVTKNAAVFDMDWLKEYL